MAQTIQFRRGNESNLPSLAPGEPAVTLDTQGLYFGSPTGNIQVAKQLDIDKRGLDVTKYGAKGDWNGTSGTNNLSAFNTAVNELPSTGGTIYVPEGDYWFSDAWVISQDNVTVFLSPNAILRTTTQTPFGGLLTFKGLGTGTVPTLKNGRVTGGGTIITPASLDNAIGFVRCDGCYVDDVSVSAGHKGVTTQQYNKNIVIRNVHVLQANTAGIALETGVENVVVENIQIDTCGKGVMVLGDGPRGKNIIVRNITVNQSTGDGVQASTLDQVSISNVIGTNIGGRGVSVDNSSNVSLKDITLSQVTQHGVNLAYITKALTVSGITLDGVSVTASNTYNGFMFDNVIIPFSVMNSVLIGTTHKYAVNIGSSSGNTGLFMGNVFAKGASDGTTYAGWAPKRVMDVFGGTAYTV